MTTRWLVAKYIPDMRRREPINVGLILVSHGRVFRRFMGQRRDGSIDGRTVKAPVEIDNYKAWVEYWEHKTEDADFDVAALVKHRSVDNYFLEQSGERLVGADETKPEAFLEQLYSMLVEDTPARETLSVAVLSENLLETLKIVERVRKDWSCDVTLKRGVKDPVRFDYRYDNGAINLMQRLNLAWNDERSWDQVHAAKYKFGLVATRSLERGKKTQAIGLVKARPNDAELKKQLAVLGESVQIVDVSKDDAAKRLSKLLHVK